MPECWVVRSLFQCEARFAAAVCPPGQVGRRLIVTVLLRQRAERCGSLFPATPAPNSGRLEMAEAKPVRAVLPASATRRLLNAPDYVTQLVICPTPHFSRYPRVITALNVRASSGWAVTQRWTTEVESSFMVWSCALAIFDSWRR